jgi:hypothetical protein
MVSVFRRGMETEGRKREGFRVFVRFREGTAKVVGVED